jgi:hypothetical protein
MQRESVYLETTVVSYLTAMPSRDIVVLAHQQVTREWFEKRVNLYDVCVSELVIQEAAEGDPEAAKKRLKALADFKVIEITSQAERLAGIYLHAIPILKNAIRDALHLGDSVGKWYGLPRDLEQCPHRAGRGAKGP